MTKDNDSLNLADAYKQISEAENKASDLERMLDQLDAKMDSILKEAEAINQSSNNDVDDKKED